MKIAFFPAHPSQVWMLRPIAAEVEAFAEVLWILRDKDVAVPLANALGLDHIQVSKASSGLIGNGLELAANTLRCLRITRREGIDLWVTKYGCGNMAAWLAGKRSIAFTDDDVDLIPLAAWTSYPFAAATLATQHTRMGRWERKAVRCRGVFELSYLHPTRFRPDPTVRAELGVAPDEPYAIVRLSSLRAHHDRGIRGVGPEFLRKLIALADERVKILITSERALDPEFEPLRCPVPVHRIQHALAFAEFFLGDGQTMTTEAAMLGTPSFRINDFVGRISSMAKVEEYGLSFGFRPDDTDRALEALKETLDRDDRAEHFAARRQRYLDDHIDPVPWFAEIIKMVAAGAGRTEIQDWSRRQYSPA